jgi:Flp pilus assembly protein TadG
VNNDNRLRVPPIARSRWGRRRHSQRGAVAVEFALILPLLLLLVLGIIEFGFGYHAWDATQNAAREGARLGAVSFDENEIITRTRNAASTLDQTQLVVQVTCAPEGSTVFGTCAWNEGDTVRVQVDYTYDYITPLPGFVGLNPQMSMTSVAEARFEGQ